jgi:uncharacterized Zn finger protein
MSRCRSCSGQLVKSYWKVGSYLLECQKCGAVELQPDKPYEGVKLYK